MQRLTWLRAQWDRVGASLAVSVGLVALLLGWFGARDTAYPAEQIPYVISGAVLGVILVGIGATAWLSADLRDEWRKLDRIEQILVTAATPGDHPPIDQTPIARAPGDLAPGGQKASERAPATPVGTAAGGDPR